MKTIKLNIVNETIYYEKLDNGLEIYTYYDKDIKNNAAWYLTKFGGLDIEFTPIGEKEMIKVPSGIAHFLEHKLFEQEKMNIVLLTSNTSKKDKEIIYEDLKTGKIDWMIAACCLVRL